MSAPKSTAIVTTPHQDLGIVELHTRLDFTVDPLLQTLLHPTATNLAAPDQNSGCTIVVNNVC